MRRIGTILVSTLIAAGGIGAGCDVDKTQEGELPEVEVQEGQMPRYDADAPEVDVESERRVIEAPEVDVSPPREGTEEPTE